MQISFLMGLDMSIETLKTFQVIKLCYGECTLCRLVRRSLLAFLNLCQIETLQKKNFKFVKMITKPKSIQEQNKL